MMKRVAIVFAFLGLIFAVSTASADDFNAPDWREDPYTTYSIWEFDTDTNPTGPDSWSYVPGDYTPALTSPTLTVSGLATHKPEDMGEYGVWKFEDDIAIEIDNFPEENDYKEIWMQLTYYASGPPDVYAEVGVDTFWGTEIFSEASGDYIHGIWQIIIEPNPSSEVIFIAPRDCTAYMDEIVIDTICIPEPATICLLGLGALALLRKRKGIIQ